MKVVYGEEVFIFHKIRATTDIRVVDNFVLTITPGEYIAVNQYGTAVIGPRKTFEDLFGTTIVDQLDEVEDDNVSQGRCGDGDSTTVQGGRD